MQRFLWTAIGLLAISAGASAHFVFFLPESAAVKAIYSDTLKPDERVGIEKIENTKLFVVDAVGKEWPLTWTMDKAGASCKIDVPGSGTRIVAGITDFGVLQRGESKPFSLKYYPKTIVGDIPTADKAKLGDRVPLEIVPVVDGSAIRFQALVAGKPVVKTEISVMAPGDEKAQDLTTDDKGFTPAFKMAGQYGVRFRLVENKSGEDKGKKYDEMRHYATLVVNFLPVK